MVLNYRKITQTLEESKYSKREIAKRCGFTRPTLDGLLQGADVKISTLVAFADFFNKPIAFFFDEEETVINEQRTAGRDYVEKGKIEHHQEAKSDCPSDVLIAEKDERIAELKERIEELKERIEELKKSNK